MDFFIICFVYGAWVLVIECHNIDSIDASTMTIYMARWNIEPYTSFHIIFKMQSEYTLYCLHSIPVFLCH